jgi:hypothetical protein
VTIDPQLADNEKQCPWLPWIALAIFVLGLLLRLWHSSELPADVAYELDAAYRIELGQCPYVDFYFDQVMPIVIWRMLTLAVAPIVAAVTGAATNLTDCFFNIKVLGLASVLTTSALSIASYLLCWTIMKRFGDAVFAGHVRWLILLALALANLSVGFEFGEQQHLFILLFLPYLLTRWLVLEGAKVPTGIRLLAAVLAAAGASFSLMYLLVILVFEMVEAATRRSFWSMAEITFVSFILCSSILWLNLLILPKAAAATFFGWILPLRLSSLSHEDFTFYSYFTTPERRSLFYAMAGALIFAFGGLTRLQLLRPLAILAVLGLVVWQTLVLGLSADALILTYFTAMLLTIECYFSIQWITARYPRFFWHKKELAAFSLVVCACLSACAFLVGLEVHQRKLVKTGATRLRLAEFGGFRDLADVIKETTCERAPVLIINGKLRPAYPLLAKCNRRVSGYFMGTDALGTLSNIRNRRFFEDYLGTSEALTKLVEKVFYQKLVYDILKNRPELICIEGGDMEGTLKLYGALNVILTRYDRICEAKYYSDRSGPREISEFNYNYWVYRIKEKKEKQGKPEVLKMPTVPISPTAPPASSGPKQ